MVEVKNPCKKDCPDRSATCHGTCEAYKDYYEYRRQVGILKAKASATEEFARSVIKHGHQD